MATRDFLGALRARRLLFDGAMGTMLQAAVPDAGPCPEMLNIAHPGVVAGIHGRYARAGAQAVETNTLGANGISLARHGLAERLEQIVAAGVRCAREGVGEGGFVALSVGPTGELMRPLGALSPDAGYEAYRRQVVAGEAAGADVVYVETMTDIAEARLAILAAKEHTALPIVCSFTYEANGRTLMGGMPTNAAAIARSVGADVVATNCSGGPAQLLAVLKETREGGFAPMIVQPNAGLPKVSGGAATFPLGPEEMARDMAPILEAGAAAIGGCCGTTPEHIEAMGRVLSAYGSPPVPKEPPPGMLTSQRKAVALERAREGLCEIGGTADELYGADPSASCVLIDVRALRPDAIASLIQEAAGVVFAPLAFRVAFEEQALAALRAYSGVAGVLGDASADAMARYGALRL